jgi:hypothetical protein
MTRRAGKFLHIKLSLQEELALERREPKNKTGQYDELPFQRDLAKPHFQEEEKF